jgi:2-dehydro-3-deoxyphosphogluconate aldolase/(4S)-4-hydroxy-2-oxoglutarate aldolase
MDASTLLSNVRLLPVVVIHDANQAVPLAEALLTAGMNAIEVTLRTECALRAIENIATTLPEMILGAGSVRRAVQFAEIEGAGANFAVSPGHSVALLQAAADKDMPYLPGAATASECLNLLDHGYRLQKFFPAELCGGIDGIKAISGPLPEVRFCATGGITAELAPKYLALDAVACIGGSWFVPDNLLRASNFAGIGKLSEEAVALSHG